jgi:hypothetical protein
MCLPCHLRDPKTRFLMVIGNLSLVAAILMLKFFRPSTGAAQEWTDGLSGLLFGISIGINLMAIRSGRRLQSDQPKEI